MREESSSRDNMIDRNWLLKRKRKRITSGLGLSNGKESTSRSSESLLNNAAKRKKGDIHVSRLARKIKGQDGVRYLYLLNIYFVLALIYAQSVITCLFCFINCMSWSCR